MKEQIWEQGWDNFSKKEIREELERDDQLEAEHRKMLEWVQSHEEEVKNAIQQDQRSDSFPRDDVFSFTLDTEIEGHHLYWHLEYAMSRDGDEESDGEMEIDGQEPNTKASWDLDQYLADLCSEMI